MKRVLVTASLLVGLGIGPTVFASQTISSICRDYEIRRVEPAHEYKAGREANEYAYHRERDILRAERARVLRLDCGDT